MEWLTSAWPSKGTATPEVSQGGGGLHRGTFRSPNEVDPTQCLARTTAAVINKIVASFLQL